MRKCKLPLTQAPINNNFQVGKSSTKRYTMVNSKGEKVAPTESLNLEGVHTESSQISFSIKFISSMVVSSKSESEYWTSESSSSSPLLAVEVAGVLLGCFLDALL